MRAIDRVDAIDATLVSAPTGHAVSERDLVLGVGGLDGTLPVVQRLRCEYAQAIAYTSYVVVAGGVVKVNPQDRARAISIVEDAHRRFKRVLGANHQLTKAAEGILFNLNLKGPGPK